MSAAAALSTPLVSSDRLAPIVAGPGPYGAVEHKAPASQSSASSITPAAPVIDAATLALAMQLVASGALTPKITEETLPPSRRNLCGSC